MASLVPAGKRRCFFHNVFDASGGVRLGRIVALAFGLLLAGLAVSVIHDSDLSLGIASDAVDIYYLAFANVRNGLFEGWFYVALGALLGVNLKRSMGVPLAVSLALALFGMLACIFITPNAHLPFCIMFSTGVFLIVIRKQDNRSSSMPQYARNASTIIYLVHIVYIVICVYAVFGWEGVWQPTDDVPHIVLFVFVALSSMATSVIVIIASKRFPAIKRFFGI